MVSADELLAGELIEALRQPLREAAAVREHDRAVVGSDQLEQARVDRRPDAVTHVPATGVAARLLLRREDLAEPAHVLHRHDHAKLERLPATGIDDRDVAAGPVAAEKAGDRLERPLRRREANPLEWRRVRCPEVLEALEGEGQMRPALRPGDRVDLVEDDRLDLAERLAGGAREQQVEALRRGDEDVRRPLRELPAVLPGRVAGAARDRDARLRLPEAVRGQRDPVEGGAQVALDVVRQRLERRDVEDADGPGVRPRRLGRRLTDEAVEAP